MDMKQIEDLADAAILDGIIEGECLECGITIQCEPDAKTVWCDHCGRVVRVRNILRELGLI